MIAACNIHHVMIYIFQGWLSLILFWPILLLCQKLLETFFCFSIHLLGMGYRNLQISQGHKIQY